MKITIAIECHSVEEARHTLDQLGRSSTVTFVQPPTVFGGGSAPAAPPVEELAHTDLLPYIPDGVDDQPVRFGKYKGSQSARGLLTVDPAYIIWADENIEWKPFTPECVKAARVLTGQLPREVFLTPDQPPSFEQFYDDDIPF